MGWGKKKGEERGRRAREWGAAGAHTCHRWEMLCWPLMEKVCVMLDLLPLCVWGQKALK